MNFLIFFRIARHAAAHPINVYIFPLQECSESCGGGQQRSTRVVEQQPSGGGEECGELGKWLLKNWDETMYQNVFFCNLWEDGSS